MTDSIKNRLICYIQDIRSECHDNSITQQLTIKFVMGSTLPYLFVYVTTTTDEDITKDGVIYTGLDSYM